MNFNTSKVFNTFESLIKFELFFLNIISKTQHIISEYFIKILQWVIGFIQIILKRFLLCPFLFLFAMIENLLINA